MVFPFLHRRSQFRSTSIAHTTEHESTQTTLSRGHLNYSVEKAANGSGPSYQDASGAPVETSSPLGYAAGGITVAFLNFSKMVGTGVYSTPASILTGTGSVGLSLIFWFLGFLIALSSLSVYLEFAAYFPNRSGSEVVYLEQAYPRPIYFFPIAFAVQSVILSFSASNAIVLAQYLYRINGHTPSPWELKGVAVAGYSIATLFLVFSTRFSYRLSNGIGLVKLITLIFVAITGLVVLGGNTSVHDPTANFRDAFEGTRKGGYGVTNALVKIIFSYAGYENAFNIVNEVKNPVKTIKLNAFVSLLVVAILYQLANVAYFAAVPKAEFQAAKVTAASLFFTKVFGSGGAVRGLNFLIALSAFGNLIAVLLGQSRMIRECGRQGVLPWPQYWASTKPFGTPLGPYFIKWLMTFIMIVGPPAGDSFNFAVDLRSYPQAFFDFAMAAGILLVRYRRRKLNLPRGEFKAWDVAVFFTVLVNTYLLAMPWYPPEDGRYGGDVNFWYATYVVTGIGILGLCFLYYIVWMYGLPKLGKYRIRQETLSLENDALAHRLVKVPVAHLDEWDATHDAVGRVVEVQNSDISTDDRSGLIESIEQTSKV